MREFLKLRNYYIFCRILIIIIFIFIAKFIYDFSLMSSNIKINNKNDIKYNKTILDPRIQIENNGFEYIKADKGYLNEDDYVFENVNMSGDFGNITAGRLDIKNNKNILEFTINPNFTIYIDEM